MSAFKAESLELYITSRLALIVLPIPVMYGLWAYSQNLHGLTATLLAIVLLAVLVLFVHQFRKTILATFERASLHLEAVYQEDYNQWSKPNYPQGKVAQFHQQLKNLSADLQQKKTRNDQHVFWVYQLISQLESPMLVFNDKQQLTYGNVGFYHLYNQPWQMYHHASPRILGLQNSDSGWQFEDKSKHQQWQIRSSQFGEAGESYQLLMFINIESALRASQLNAWQQIIRVLGHEIRNSLTPVSSLAESLATRAASDRDKTALEVITGRCQHLQDFVSRYSSLTKKLHLSCQWLPLETFAGRIVELFKPMAITTCIKCERVWADVSFIEQVLINLLKNAVEAKAENIRLSAIEADHQTVIKVIDDGHGFTNLDNLFVPLYTTKQQGQGIGLSFCRNIIEQHNGSIDLSNNKDKGVTVTIKLPVKD